MIRTRSLKVVVAVHPNSSFAFEGFPINTYKYKPIINVKPFITLQASKGCPYSCRYYCTYPASEGIKVRSRSPKKLVDDILDRF